MCSRLSALSRSTKGWALGAIALASLPAQRIEPLRATGALPAHIAGAFRDPKAFQQTDAGRYLIFDQRAHAVFAVDHDKDDATVRKIVEIGREPGRLFEPTAFDSNPADGMFVVADSPQRGQRIQIFNADGGLVGGFFIDAREVARITVNGAVLNGIGSLQFTGHSILINQPETGALISELGLSGQPLRAVGRLRATGHEADRDLHLALNAGFPLLDPTGGFYFVFGGGEPIFRKYDANGALVFERHIEGPEIDEYLKTVPTTWPKRKNEDGDTLPYVPAAIRTARVDRTGRLWISLMQEPVTYVYDRAGDKARTVQFSGAGVLTPTSFFFAKDGRVLVTPGCFEFK